MFLTNERVFLYGIYSLGAALWFLLWEFLTTIFSFLPPLGFLQSRTVESMVFAGVSLAISVAAVEAVRRNRKSREFGVEVVVETKKVTWPTMKELQGSTLVVILMSLISMFLIFGMDKIFDALIRVVFQTL